MLDFAIKEIYPEIQENEYELKDDGAGAYISSWSFSGEQPSSAQLLATIPTALKKQKISQVKKEAARRIFAAYPQYQQNNAALGLYDAARITAICNGINTIRNASDVIESAIMSLPDTVEIIDSFDISVGWPQ